MNQRIGFLRYCVLIIMLFSGVYVGTVQELCEELSREIFEDTDDNCSDTDDENACYGFDTISATFFEDVGDNFSGPGELVEMLQLHTLRSSPFDEEEEEWGIGYFRIDIEESDNPLIIIVAGDVIVENDIESAQEDDLTAMQAFNFTTGGASSCNEAPNAVFIQGPQDAEVNLIINSTPLRIGSTVVLGTNNDGNDNGEQDNSMWIGVVDGYAILHPDTPDAMTIEEGTFSSVSLTNRDGNSQGGNNLLNTIRVPVINPLTGEQVVGPNGRLFYRQIPTQPFSEPQAISNDGTGPGNWSSYRFLVNVPSGLLNYPVSVPDPEPENTNTNTSSNSSDTTASSSVSSSSSDDNLTDCGTQNWCNSGEPWGDGRCNDSDPDVSSWYWSAGWYNAQLACGAISEIPEVFQGAEQAPVVVQAPAPAPVVPTSTCFDTTVGGWFDQTYTSPESLGSANTWSSTDGSCSGTNTGPQTLIQAVGNAAAIIRCQALGGAGTVTEMSFYSYIGGANYWFCS